MAKRSRNMRKGFSLVELLVAVLFIGILMAGMANVFKSSVTVLATSGEGISSMRRNRMSIDLLYDDLNTAGLYITDLSSPPVLDIANPAFYVIPNVPIVGAAADDPQTADELYFYLDQPLPFEGTLELAGIGTAELRSAAEQVMDGTPAAEADQTFTIDCKDASYASMVKAGYSVVIKDSWETLYIQGDPRPSGKNVTFRLGADPSVAMTGLGASGGPPKTKHIKGSAVMFYQPAQMVKYSVAMRFLDPQKATGTPCLIREQDTYNPAGFTAATATANRTSSIVTENVSGFKVYLSANSGQSWAGLGSNYTGFASGWTNGMRADLDAQLATAGRQDFKGTQGNEGWIRSIPTLVRLDITTRTAMKRAEYAAVPTTTAYKDFTQSLVIVPRHFGLPMN